MDKYEFKVRLNEIWDLLHDGEIVEAVEIADTIDWTKIRNVNTLCKISDLYKANKRFAESKEILLMAYERNPGGRLIVYSLCDLSIRLGEYVQAIEYYKEFAQLAPKDTNIYILKYRLFEANDVSLEERIGVLEQYKRAESKPNPKWCYELAMLYHQIGLSSECVEECEEMIAAWGENRYTIKAIELKLKHEPLRPSEQAIYDKYKQGLSKAATEDKPVEIYDKNTDIPSSIDTADLQAAPTSEIPQEIDIQVKPVDVGQYNTMNLQEALAESMKELLDTDEDEIAPSIPEEGLEDNTIFGPGPLAGNHESDPVRNVFEESRLTQPASEAVVTPNVTPGPGRVLTSDAIPVPETVPTPVAMPVHETVTLMQEEENPAPESIVQTYSVADYPPPPSPEQEVVTTTSLHGITKPVINPAVLAEETKRIPTDAVVDYIETQRIMKEMQTSSASIQATDVQAEGIPGAVTGQLDTVGPVSNAYDQMLAEEYSGQIRLAISEADQVEKQITGQLSIDDVLADWEETKKENSKKREDEVRKRILQHTGSLFDEFDEDTKATLLEQLEKAFMEAILKESNSADNDDALGRKIRREAMRAVEYMTMDGIIGKGVSDAASVDTVDNGEDKAAEDMPSDNETTVEPDKETSEKEDAEPTGDEDGEEAGKETTEETAKDSIETAGENTEETLPDNTEDNDTESEEEAADESTDKEPEETTEEKSVSQTEPDGTDSIEVAAVRKALEEDEKEKSQKQADDAVTETKENVKQGTDEEKGSKEEDETGDSDEGSRVLTNEEIELFGGHLTRKSTKKQIIHALDNMSMAAYTGNVIVTGEEGVGTLDLATKLIKYMQMTDSNFVNRQIIKATGKGLNEKDLTTLFEQVKGGAIIIKNSRGMKKSTVVKLIKILENENLGVLVLMEDTSEGMDKIVGTLPKLRELFNVRIDLKPLDDKALVNYACEYARSQEHSIDEYALLALHTRIAELQTSSHQVSVSEVRDLVDDAIYYADKKNLTHLFDIILHKRYDEDDMIILRERDFMHY
ncbi:MAG: hypothetical protein K6G12_01475 [Lachnospiraceae bacterium]|nr:hypothetical protein [Lachnospiraceae bacterium]